MSRRWLMMMLLFALAGGVAGVNCASTQPKSWHSPMWKSCKVHCGGPGTLEAAVVESDDGRACYCKAPPT